ncbi:DUF1571 domain-containing protein [Fimbriiglobus ruber]|uniref:DUF1571 domain-containing protein n=1 Tax=Fimbriiglobus ruber TaxID=1908690 RepID=A0A225EDT4_9BACT|nr:DUF1571 domain-containing protein [Fimbriiglobus ruber]OWK47459.1 hypothetical protein FRUB_01158 [Fimbriiglobus ruber]
MARHTFLLPFVGAVCLAAAPSPPCPPVPEPRPTELVSSAGDFTLPTADEFGRLARTDPIAMLDAARRRFRAEVKTYRATLVKQERVAGTLNPPEEILIAGREEPFAVLLLWRTGARSVFGFPVEGTLFAAGENNGKMVVWRPAALLRTIDIPPTDGQARAASRYSVAEAGLYHAVDRTYRAWEAARHRGRFSCEYLGTRPVASVGGRVCHVVRRTCDPPELDAFASTDPPPDADSRPADAHKTITVTVDAETWLQVGSELRRADGELVGVYDFRDVELNPSFTPTQFKTTSLKK